jgi:death on curing protein
MRYLRLDQAMRIHDLAIQRYGGSPELADLGRLESALATPQQTMFGRELYLDLVSKAAILMYLLVKNHPFVDGNKRTGVLSMLRFLLLNGHTLNATNDELYQVTIAIASSAMDKDELSAWIHAHLQKAE